MINNNRTTIDYLIENYGDFIVEFRNREDLSFNQKSWLRISVSIIDQEQGKFLGERNPDRLRKSIAKAHLELTSNNDVSNESVTSEKGYEENAVGSDAFKDYCKRERIDYSKVASCKFLNYLPSGPTFNVVMKFDKEKREETYMDLRDEIIKDMDKHSPSFIEYKSIEKKEKGRLLVLGLADLHIGQLTYFSETHEIYNIDIAIKKTTEAVLSILHQAEGFNISEVLVPIGGDLLNSDHKGGTTKGTPQDNDSLYDSFTEARKMYVSIIENILARGYKIEIQYIPGNHDMMSSAFLCDSVASYFRNTDIVFDIDMFFRKYKTFGDNLICQLHMDGIKPEKAGMLMANESKDWSSSKFRYIYSQHVHHGVSHLYDSIGVTVQSLRTPVAASQWAHSKGYQGSPSSITGFVHDKKAGQIAQLNYNFID